MDEALQVVVALSEAGDLTTDHLRLIGHRLEDPASFAEAVGLLERAGTVQVEDATERPQ